MKKKDFILKRTSALGNLIIKPVAKELAKEMIVNNHYSHKWNAASFGKFNYGIYREEQPDKCLGVAVYGYMKTPYAKIFTHPNPTAWMCELNRLWIDDDLGYVSIRPCACFFPFFSFLPLCLHNHLNPLCVQS